MHFLPQNTVYGLVFLMAAFGGLRTLTPLAVLSWATFKQRLHLQDTPFFFLGHIVSVVVFTLIAVGELIGDKLPTMASRKEPRGFLTRVFVGAFIGLVLCAAEGLSLPAGAGVGMFGAIAGTMLGYEVRVRSVKLLHVPDFVVALVEDAIAVGGCIWVVVHF